MTRRPAAGSIPTAARAIAALLIASPLVFAAAAGEASPAPVAAPPPVLGAEQRAGIMALYDRAVALGFPEGRGAHFVSGMIAIRSPEGGVSGWGGIHARCSDGRWFIRNRLLTAAASATVDAGSAPALAGLLADGVPPAGRGRNAFDLLVGPDRAAAERALRALDPDVDGITPAMALFALRAGLPGSDAAWIAKSASVEQLRPDAWLVGARLFLNGDSYRTAFDRWLQRNRGTLHAPDPVAAARRTLCGWFMERRLDGDLSPAHALAGALAMTDPASHPVLRRRMEDLDRCDAVPAVPAPADADLATRLRSWDPDRHMPRWSRADLPDLFALLGDPRPAAGFGGPARTCGDRALAAIARILRFDPRELVGGDADAPWTDAERAATAAALQAWWRGARGRPLDEALAERIESATPAAMMGAVDAAPAGRRQALLDRIVLAWTTVPPEPVAFADVIARILEEGDPQGVSAMVRAWPAGGPIEPLLACWYDRHGDPTRLDALLGRDLGSDATMTGAVCLLLTAPEPGRVGRLLSLASLPPDDPRLWNLISCLPEPRPGGMWGEAQGYQLHGLASPVHSDSYAALLVRLLADRRPLPASAVVLESPRAAHGMPRGLIFCGRVRCSPRDAAVRHDAAPADLRICDVAAILDGDVDPWAGREALDAAADGLRERWGDAASRALRAAGIPEAAAPPSRF